jgi:CubicO group peptidase (beta-lactamase class C family)
MLLVMAALVSKLNEIQTALEALARQHKVPGASLAVLRDSELVQFATGVTSRTTEVAVTPETLFQIGSNTKLYTTTLVMQLVDSGEVDLDAPVRQYVPEFKLADSAALTTTVRQLLTHSSGIPGDFFEEYGSGDDGIERYVAALSELSLAHAVGAMFSYSNAGFVLAGRVVEKVRKMPYRLALRDHLLGPIGARSTTVMPEEMLAFRYAVGHMAADGRVTPAKRVLMSLSHAPAGSVTSATARDVLRFVRMHLDGGRGRGGQAVLSEASVTAMQTPQVKRPPNGRGTDTHVGLGWMIDEWSGERVIGHGGGTIGQLSFLEVVPSKRFAVCLLTNSATGGVLWDALARYLFAELAGIDVPPLPAASEPAPKLDLRRYTGRFTRVGSTTEVRAEGDTLAVTLTPTGPLAEVNVPQTVRMTPIDAETFVGPAGAVMTFMDFDARGRPAYLHMGRVARREVSRGTAGAPARSAPSKSRSKTTSQRGRPATKEASAASRAARAARS